MKRSRIGTDVEERLTDERDGLGRAFVWGVRRGGAGDDGASSSIRAAVNTALQTLQVTSCSLSVNSME
jgi:hypothetical protein